MSALLASLRAWLAGLCRRASAPVEPTEDDEDFRAW